MIRIKFYKAKSGDAFLISFGEDKKTNVMIDMGFVSTYEDYIKKDLKQLRKNGENIDLLIITHIDKDHIRGAINFILENGVDQKIIQVKEVWHNSYRHLQFDKKKNIDISQNEKQALKNLINQNKINYSDGVLDISAKDGTTLASLLFQFEYKWNDSFNSQAIKCLETKEISDLIVTTISPDEKKLDFLAKKWKKKLNSIVFNFKMNSNEIFDDAFELFMQNLNESRGAISNSSSVNIEKYTFDEIINLASEQNREDNSPTNGSSMGFIFHHHDKRLLFLGDAHEDLIYSNLLKLKSNGDDLKFDLVKISHHGSSNNTSNRLLELLDASKYIISTDGCSFEHPSINTIAKIISKKTPFRKIIYFNYDIEHIKPFNNIELKTLFNYDIIITDEITLN